MMRLEYNKDEDVAYIYVVHPIKDGQSKKTARIKEDIILDFDAQGKLLGVEVLNASKHLDKKVILEAEHAQNVSQSL